MTQKILRVVLFLHGSVEAHRELLAPAPVTLGPDSKALLLTPPIGLPDGVALLEPTPGGYSLALVPGFTGTVTLGGTELPVAAAYGSASAGPGNVRRIPLSTDDFGLIGLDDEGALGLLFQFVTPAERVPRGYRIDPFLLQALLLSLLLVGGTVGVSWFFAPETLGSELEIRPERIARYLPKKKPDEQKKKEKPDEAALAKKLAEAPRQLAVVPKAREVALTERQKLEQRVAKRGALKVMDELTRRDSAMKRLFERDTTAELSRSLDSLVDDAKARAAAESAAAAGGAPPTDSTRGSSMGGGGTGVSFGQVDTRGKIDTGGAGTVAAKLASARERKVSVSVAPGDPMIDGGLPRESISRVIRAHQAGIKYCYETELSRLPKLNGKIVIQFRIDLDGQVIQPRIRTTTMNNTAVEACLVRQIARWHFPKPAGSMVEVSYPFLFRSGL